MTLEGDLLIILKYEYFLYIFKNINECYFKFKTTFSIKLLELLQLFHHLKMALESQKIEIVNIFIH